ELNRGEGVDAPGLRPDGAGGGLASPGPHPRRERYGQGARRPGAAFQFVAALARLSLGELRRDPRDAARERVVRLRPGGVHGRGPRQEGALRNGRRRDALPRRGGRHAALDAGEAAAGPAGRGVSTGRLEAEEAGEGAGRGGDERRSPPEEPRGALP